MANILEKGEIAKFRQEIMDEARKEGKKEGRIDVAKNMLKKDFQLPQLLNLRVYQKTKS